MDRSSLKKLALICVALGFSSQQSLASLELRNTKQDVTSESAPSILINDDLTSAAVIALGPVKSDTLLTSLSFDTTVTTNGANVGSPTNYDFAIVRILNPNQFNIGDFEQSLIGNTQYPFATGYTEFSTPSNADTYYIPDTSGPLNKFTLDFEDLDFLLEANGEQSYFALLGRPTVTAAGNSEILSIFFSSSVVFVDWFDVVLDARDLVRNPDFPTPYASFAVAAYGLRLGDFNDDGVLDCTDINLLTQEIVRDSNAASFDLTGDGLVDEGDQVAWLSAAGEVNLGPGLTYLPGDANLDGTVDVSDFNLWNSNKFTPTPAWCSADFNADGSVDVSDFNLWNSNKFISSGDYSLVPEPAGFLMTLLAFAALVHYVK